MTDYLWKSDWLAADREFKSSMLITMARLRKPVFLTAGDFAPLTLTTFVAVSTTLVMINILRHFKLAENSEVYDGESKI